MFTQKMLRDAIFAKGISAVESFAGMEIRPGATQEEMNDLFAQAYAQMPEDVLTNYEAQYLGPVQAKITHRILLQGHIQGCTGVPRRDKYSGSHGGYCLLRQVWDTKARKCHRCS